MGKLKVCWSGVATSAKLAIVGVLVLFLFGTAVGSSEILGMRGNCYGTRPVRCQSADMTFANLSGANLRGAEMPDGTIHD